MDPVSAAFGCPVTRRARNITSRYKAAIGSDREVQANGAEVKNRADDDDIELPTYSMQS